MEKGWKPNVRVKGHGEEEKVEGRWRRAGASPPVLFLSGPSSFAADRDEMTRMGTKEREGEREQGK
jgi:hypothetical protein